MDADQGLSTFKVTISFKPYSYVADHYYLKPLLPIYHEDGLYYLLELSQDYVKLYEATRHGFRDVYVEDFAPERLEEAVGFDYRPKMLQFISGQNAHGEGSFHGHGEGKDDDKKELTTFFRAVDKGIKKVVADQNAPLVLACVDSLYDMYKKVTTHPNLYHKNVGGDPEFKEKKSLHQESWTLIEPYFQKTKKAKLERYNELYHSEKTSSEIHIIRPAAMNGTIDTLFIVADQDVFGLFDKEKGKVIHDDKRLPQNLSLTNKAALDTYLQGGKVYLQDADTMPIKESIMSAIFRY